MKKIERIKPVNGFDIEDYYDKETNRFLINKFANYLLDNFDFIRVGKAVYHYKDGIYQIDDDYISKLCVAHSDRKNCRMFSDNTIKNLMSKIKDYADEYEASETEEPHLIAFRNGIYDSKNNVLLPFSKDYFLTCKIDWDYDPNAYSPEIDKLLDDLSNGNKEIRTVMEELIGYTMIRSLYLHAAFFLIGEAGNGKSVFTNLLKTLLGKNNYSTVDITDICKNKYAGACLQGKLANIVDDASYNFIDNPATFKMATSGGEFTAEKKYQDPYNFQSYAVYIADGNGIPIFKKADKGVRRRMIIIPFTRTFYGTKDCDVDLEDKLREAHCIDNNMSYLINLGVKGLNRLYENKKFTMPKISEKLLDEYDRDCNPMLDWCDEFLEEHGGTFEGIPTYVAYNDYDSWRQVTNNKATTQRNLTKFIKERYGLITESKYYKPINKTTQLFMPKDGG